MIPGSVSRARPPRSSGRSSLSFPNVFSASQTHYRVSSQLSITKECVQITQDTTADIDTFPCPGKRRKRADDTYRCRCCKQQIHFFQCPLIALWIKRPYNWNGDNVAGSKDI